MTYFIEHTDSWIYAPPAPPNLWRGWWVSNDDGEPMHGPFKTKESATEHLEELILEEKE